MRFGPTAEEPAIRAGGGPLPIAPRIRKHPAHSGRGGPPVRGDECASGLRLHADPHQPSLVARAEHAELIALGIGENHEPGVLRLPDVHPPRTQRLEPPYLGLLVVVRSRRQVEM
jgi:hypothetical protein